MYPEEYVIPLKKELTDIGFENLNTVEEVEEVMKNEEKTTLVVVNSICGCAAKNARPAVKLALQGKKKPKKLVTVFAGYDVEAVEEIRKYFLPFPPSSPSIALMKNKKIVFFLERHIIETKTLEQISEALSDSFNEFCE